MKNVNANQNNSRKNDPWYYEIPFYTPSTSDNKHIKNFSEIIRADEEIRTKIIPSFKEILRHTFREVGQIPTNPQRKADVKKQNNNYGNNLSIPEKYRLDLLPKEVREAILKSESPKRTLQKIRQTQDDMNNIAKLTDEEKIKIAKGECDDPIQFLTQNLAKTKPELNTEYEIFANKICNNNKNKRIALDMLHKEITDLKELEDFITSLQTRMTNEELAKNMLDIIAKGDKDKQGTIKKTPFIEAVTTFIPQNIGKPHNPPALRAQINKRLGCITSQSRVPPKKEVIKLHHHKAL